MNRDHPYRLLVAAWYFPPFAGVNGLRAMKFCKYLPAHGWRPTVLTVATGYYRGRVTASEPRELASLDVARLPYVPIPASTLLCKLAWPLCILAWALRNRSRCDAVFLSGGPFYPFLLTPVLSRLLRIPVVLDFRDSWSSAAPLYGGQRPRLASLFKRCRRSVEHVGIRFARAVTFATDTLTAEFEVEHPRFCAKYRTVPNGQDPEDYRGIRPRRAGPERTLVLTGKFLFYTPEVARGLFEVLQDHPEVRFLYIGGEEAEVRALAKETGLAERTTCLPFLAREELLEWIAGADLALMTNYLVNGLGTKIFDYLALEKPTLCFVPEGSIVSRLFRGSPSVLVREAPHTPESIAAGLRDLLLLGDFRSGGELAAFDRRKSTEDLARILDAAIAGDPPPA